MTREDRHIVSLDEISAVRWRCPNCSVEVSYKLDGNVSIPGKCPACNADPDLTKDNPNEFVKSLKTLLASQQGKHDSGALFLEFVTDSSLR